MGYLTDRGDWGKLRCFLKMSFLLLMLFINEQTVKAGINFSMNLTRLITQKTKGEKEEVCAC